MNCECIEMDDNIHPAVNHPYDEIIPKTATQEVGKHPELSILFKIEWCEGGPLPPFLLTTEAICAMCDAIEVPRPIHITLLKEYEAIFEFSVEYNANSLMMSLQKVDTWFSL